MRFGWLVGLLCFSFLTVMAGKPINKADGPVEVGHSELIGVLPDLSVFTTRGATKVWQDSIRIGEAAFLKPHFVNMNLLPGDRLIVRSERRVIEEFTGRGFKNMGSFWGLSSFGELIIFELEFTHDYGESLPFQVDMLIVGDSAMFDPVGAGNRSICAPPDFEDVICYEGDPEKWANVMASVGVMTVGNTPGAPGLGGLWCSGSTVSPQSHVLTNWHCVPDVAPCSNAEFVYKYYNDACGGGVPTPDWQGFHCDETVALSPFVSCEQGLSDLDFSLSTAMGDPAATFGYAEVDPVPITDGEAIYIIQHPDGRPHEITHGSGADVDADGTVFRYYNTLDTEGGSSGSPIFREADHKVVGLHHCGGCSTAGTGNRGMLISDIYPHIAEFLCTPDLQLQSAGTENLVEVMGNGNAFIEPGETWQFTPRVRNTACGDDATGVMADVVVGSGSIDITLLTSSVSFGSLAAGTAGPSSGSVQFQVSPLALCGGEVIIDLENITANEAGPFTGAELIRETTGGIVRDVFFMEDFAGGIPGSWTIVNGGTGSGAAETWTTDNPGNRNLSLVEPFAIADSDELGSGMDMDEEMITSAIDASGTYDRVLLEFQHDFNWFSGSQDEQCDVDVMSSATDGSWVTVANFSGADASGAISVDITDHAAADLQLRFHYYDATFEFWWAVDDIYLVGETAVCETYALCGTPELIQQAIANWPQPDIMSILFMMNTPCDP